MDYTEILQSIEAHLYHIEGCCAALIGFLGLKMGFDFSKEFFWRAFGWM